MLKRVLNLLQNPHNTVHHTISMLLHYLEKLKVHICCSTSAHFKVESQCSYCPLILMFSTFKTAEVLPANWTQIFSR